MKPNEVKALVEEMVEAWNGRDLDRLIQMLTEDVVWDDPAMQSPAVGRDAVLRFSETVFRAFPDFKYSIRHPICVAVDGSRCAVPWRITATHLGKLDPPGYAPTGKSATFEGVDLIDFDGQKACRIETLFNVAAPAEQFLSLQIRPRAGSLHECLAVLAQRFRALWLRKFCKPSPR